MPSGNPSGFQDARVSPLVAFPALADAPTAGGYPGWPTTSATKPILVDDLAEAINTGALRVGSALLANECSSFILTENGSAKA